MAKRVEVAERLIELGFDPVEMMVKMAKAAKRKKNHALAAKIASDLLEYTAPKLKSMEHSIAPDTIDFLKTREARLERIRVLMAQIKNTGTGTAAADIVDAEFIELLPSPNQS